MKFKNNFKKGTRLACSTYNLLIKSVIVSTFILTGIQTQLQAQKNEYSKPSWWFGVAAGANGNFYNGSTQQLNAELTVPTTFTKGTGVGLYLAPLIEFHPEKSVLGIMLQTGYDSRRGKFKQVINPCNCPADLSTDLSYFVIEPSLKLTPFKSGFYIYAGPRMAFILNKSFTYKLGINPTYPSQTPTPDVKGDFSNVNNTQISAQIGAGYDISMSSKYSKTQSVISPFVSFQPYFGQTPRSIETWNITTVRAGIAFKFGSGHKISAPVQAVIVVPVQPVVVVADPKVEFSVYAPKNIPSERMVKEVFPLRNYIFFDIGSSVIPDRYVMLRKEQVKDFKEDQLEFFTPKNLSGRSVRQMVVYYNVINILGDRMGKDPSSTIKLVGSSENGPEDGKVMAGTVKSYLVNVFGINDSRIIIEGRVKPKIPSEHPGGTKELDLLSEGNRRVSIESGSSSLLMEFQSGPDAPLRPVEINAVQEAPIDSYVSFNAEGSEEAFSSWSLSIKDESGVEQKFGPYTQDKISIPGKSILGTRPEGNYNVTMIGQTKTGKTITKETTVHMVLWTPAKVDEGMRFSVIFEFNDSKAISIYEKYLTDIVTPKIPAGGTVIIHGHTDIIGEEAYNMKLSVARANEVKSIIEKALANTGRTDVKFEVYGFGKDQNLAPFENKFPEERFYNRTVIIDIIPNK